MELSRWFGITAHQFSSLYSRGLLNIAPCMDFLIRHEYRLMRFDKKRVPDIIEELSKKYGVGYTRIQKAAYKKGGWKYRCKECGSRITKSQYQWSQGLCESCYDSLAKIGSDEDGEKFIPLGKEDMDKAKNVYTYFRKRYPGFALFFRIGPRCYTFFNDACEILEYWMEDESVLQNTWVDFEKILDEVKEHGGVNGRPVKLISYINENGEYALPDVDSLRNDEKEDYQMKYFSSERELEISEIAFIPDK